MSASRILVVEDNEAIRLAVGSALGGLGYAVQTLADGTDLESRVGSFAPDLVILE